ncbi:MAG: HAD family hydrolase [Planctomycetes bacterium]|jgi:HAD superfamily hydrolase (TIGR01549 family)|nr:HAD family hydrolase [Planctomycetota bacterium]HPY76008.1 HAD family hydrolase [Planctomycetota bacterium]HQB01558.1 HAD family hydrolase [Planctomycetota bacterium]
MQNFIFDLDGTLLHTAPQVLQNLQQAYQKAGQPCDSDKFQPCLLGPPLQDIIEKLSPKLSYDIKSQIIENFHKLYDHAENDITIPFPHIIDTLQTLQKQNKKLFIATNKPLVSTHRLFQQHNMFGYFQDIYTVDKYSPPITKTQMIEEIIQKYNLEKTETTMIGDAITDAQAAKQATIYSISVLWGYEEDKQLLQEVTDKTIQSPTELLSL